MAGTDVTETWLADDDAELLKEGLRGGIMSTEAAGEDRLVFGAASCEDVVTGGSGEFGTEYPFLLEEAESVGLKDFRPFVGIVAGTVAT